MSRGIRRSAGLIGRIDWLLLPVPFLAYSTGGCNLKEPLSDQRLSEKKFVAMDTNVKTDSEVFESAIRALEAEIATAGVHMTIDANARQIYGRRIRELANELRVQVRMGRITWKQAAEEAQQIRNVVMDFIRSRSTPVGRAFAQQLKSEGRTFNELIARKTRELYGPRTEFLRLNATQQNRVYEEIVRSAGRSNAHVNTVMRRVSYAGRALIVVSITLSAYTIMTAEDKGLAARREVVVTGAGVGGGIAGGALAGLACGPGAPVCVTVGAFVGGAVAAFGVDFLW
jgi:hypothetical protein